MAKKCVLQPYSIKSIPLSWQDGCRLSTSGLYQIAHPCTLSRGLSIAAILIG